MRVETRAETAIEILRNRIYLGSKSGDYEEVRDHMYTKLLENGTLLLQNVKEDREGFYLCQAENGIGTGIGKVIQLRVNCRFSPIRRRIMEGKLIYSTPSRLQLRRIFRPRRV